MITSLSNVQVKDVILLQTKAKARQETGLFVVEGRRLVEEIPAGSLKTLYMTEAFAASAEAAELNSRGCTELVSPEVMAKMADTRNPQGVLAVAGMPVYTEERLNKGLILVLEHVQDPGNLGTIFRTAEAAGASALLMDRETADPCQPKVTRSTMGAIFRLPFVVTENLPAQVQRLQNRGFGSFAAHLGGHAFYDEVRYPEDSLIFLGNEGNGLSEPLTALAQQKILIPMEGKTESLNVAVAGALLAYEYHRQHFPAKR